MKKSRFLSNKTKKLTKIVNRKPEINQKKPGTVRGVRAHTPKNHEKTLKIELFASFVWNLS
jgi:hypothetical protein